MDFKALSKYAIKAGLIMAGVFVVTGLLGLIPFVNILVCVVNCVLIFVPGVLAGILMGKEGSNPTVGEGAILGAIAGPISTLAYIITVPAGVLLGGAANAAMMQQMGGSDAGAMMAGGVMGIVIGLPIAMVVGSIVLAACNAASGAIYGVIKNR
ncbi:MAG: hypothetical protein AB7V50_04365 [Vampirovibrionia bacterium]